jgi:hypothetical protein
MPLRFTAITNPIQNGVVPQMLGDRLGKCVLGGLSNLGATITEPGIYEQRKSLHCASPCKRNSEAYAACLHRDRLCSVGGLGRFPGLDLG